MQHKSNEYYLDIIREAAERLGRTPGVKYIHSYTSIRVRFGSWPEALRAAGLEHVPRRMTDEALVDALVAKAQALGRTPTQADINADPEMPNHTTYYRAFGTLRKAYAAAGLDASHLQAPRARLLGDAQGAGRRVRNLRTGRIEGEQHERQGHAPVRGPLPRDRGCPRTPMLRLQPVARAR